MLHYAHCIAIPRTGYSALRRGRVSEAGRVYLVTCVTQKRQRVFAVGATARNAVACFDDPCVLCANRMLAWVLMPDHAHWLLELGEPANLAQAVGRIKAAVTRRVNSETGARTVLWEPGFHDHALRREESVRDAADYIVANPLRAGLVEQVQDYPYWNTAWR